MLRNDPSSSTVVPYAQRLQEAVMTIPRGLKAVAYWPIDNVKLAWYQQEFLFTEMYERAREKNIAWIRTAPSFLAGWSRDYIPSGLYVITGSDNIMAVGDYGEKNQDPKARFFFRYLDNLVGRPNLLSTTLRVGGQEKALFREQMINRSAKRPDGEVDDFNHAEAMPPLDLVAEVARRRIKKMIATWDPTISFQEQITHLGANMVGECVLGIPELPISYIPEIRKVGEVLFEGGSNASHLQECAKFLKQLNAEVCAKHLKHIFETNKFILRDYALQLRREDELTADEKIAAGKAAVAELDMGANLGSSLDGEADSREQNAQKIALLIEELVKRSVVSMYSVEGNLSTTIMGAIVSVNENTDVKAKIMQEIKAFRQSHDMGDNEPLSVDQLRRELPYLDAVYWEVMRFMAMAAVIPRKTSVSTELKIKDSKGVPHLYPIPAHSLLFVPLRAMHLDEKIWPNPRKFDPSRFDYTYPENDPSESAPNRTDYNSDNEFAEANKNHALLLAEFEEAKKEHKAKVSDNRKRVKPFSSGVRACPGQLGFVEIIVKTALLETPKHTFTFDKEIEVIPTPAHKTTWNKTYYATIEGKAPRSQMKP